MARSYDQFCPAARALDVVGGRWSLLVVRELLLGPRRFTELAAGLPGIGPNVLAERLRALGEAGILERTRVPQREAPAPSSSSASAYALTELGEAMRPLVDELTRWGMRLGGPLRPGDTFQLNWLLNVLRASFRPEAARGVRETYGFRVAGEEFHLRVEDGALDVRLGAAPDAACVLTADLGTFMALGARIVEVEDALGRGLAALEGDREAAARSVAILGAHPGATGGRHGIIGAVGASFRPEEAREVHENYEFRIDGLVFHARVDDGTVAMEQGPAPAPGPDAVLTTRLAVLLELGAGALPLEDAVIAGAIEVEGDAEASLRMADVFGVVRTGSPLLDR